jgi:hypothetical protein
MTNRLLPYLALALFILSLALPAFTVGDQTVPGVEALLMGWIGLGFGDLTGVPWLANLLFITTVILLLTRRKGAFRAALYTTPTAILFGVVFLLVRQLPIDEAGHYGNVGARQPGYWLWLLSMLVQLVAAILGPPQKSSNLSQQPNHYESSRT